MVMSVSDLHFGYAFVHEIFASYVETVGKVVYLLVWHYSLVDLIFNHRRGPIYCPVFTIACPFKPILYEQMLD